MVQAFALQVGDQPDAASAPESTPVGRPGLALLGQGS